MDSYKIQSFRCQKLPPVLLGSLLRAKQYHHGKINCGQMRMAAGRGNNILAKQKFAVSSSHCRHNTAEDISRILIWPIVQDGAHEIYTGTMHRLRLEEVVFLALNAL